MGRTARTTCPFRNKIIEFCPGTNIDFLLKIFKGYFSLYTGNFYFV